MPAERYYIDQLFADGETHELKDAEFHHLAHVMRTRKGEQVELVNGRGALAQAVVLNVGKDKAALVIESTKQIAEKKCNLVLAQALPKQNRLDFILEKGTELGVDSFWLFPGCTSVKKEFYPNQMERARLLTIAAMKQCGRLTLPTLEVKPPLERWTALNDYAPFFGDVDPKAPLFGEAWKTSVPDSKPVLFITGPESGFTEKEIEILGTLKAKGVKLHPNILRTDTASIMALSLISHWQS